MKTQMDIVSDLLLLFFFTLKFQVNSSLGKQHPQNIMELYLLH